VKQEPDNPPAKSGGGTKVIHEWWAKDDVRQDYLQYLLDNWGEDAMRTFLAESWTMDLTRKSWLVWSNWYSDYGMCQTNTGYHPYVLRWEGYAYGSGKYFKEWFYNPYKQMDHCIKMFKGGTIFYAFKHRFERTKAIKVF